ncbi:hypothetical protein PMAYCL1PPCAC_04264 [Pristionchus mayeri]|uniref:SXP/RAL-2 family protein Ani s 5-like cation-binding domain-containing protein n=1 Tax=Pristionchus mayeri TaxID=1317129 RepID=A0AAN5C9P9_9BILA|nr:hypothetical protein PMAYCL1PPCAC_04264 [Pristionchus mayeri]
MKSTALILACIAAAALAGSSEEFTAEQKADLDAKIATLSAEAQEAAKKIKGIFEANEDNKAMAIEQTKALIATLPEGVLTEIKSIMPPAFRQELEGGAPTTAATPARARRHAQEVEAGAPTTAATPSRARRQEPTQEVETGSTTAAMPSRARRQEPAKQLETAVVEATPAPMPDQ